MITCSSCGSALPDAALGAAFCPNCGQKIATQPPPTGPRADEFSGLATVLLPDMDAATPGELTPGQEFHGRYVIDRRLGAGAMGVVYAAHDKIGKRQVAIKLIHPNLLNHASARERFIQEGLITRDIRHRNIIAMYDVSETQGQVYLVMELLPGETLRRYIARKLSAHEDVPVEAAVSLVRNILEGLAAAHEANIVHRDLKPENIMLRGDPDQGEYGLTILDFGIAQAIGIHAEKYLTSSGATGTPLYMAPEQKTADSVGPAADFYAVTVMFYELLIGVAPSGRQASHERPDLPVAIDDILDKGMSARARARYQTAREYLAALDGPIGGEPASSSPRFDVPAPAPTPASVFTPPVISPAPAPPYPPPAQKSPNGSSGLAAITEQLSALLSPLADKTPSNRPKMIGQAMKLLYISLGLGVLHVFVVLPEMEYRGVDAETFLGMAAILSAFSLYAIRAIGRGGGNWARLALLVLLGLDVLSLGEWASPIYFLRIAMQSVAMAFLFHASSSSWFKKP